MNAQLWVCLKPFVFWGRPRHTVKTKYVIIILLTTIRNVNCEQFSLIRISIHSIYSTRKTNRAIKVMDVYLSSHELNDFHQTPFCLFYHICTAFYITEWNPHQNSLPVCLVYAIGLWIIPLITQLYPTHLGLNSFMIQPSIKISPKGTVTKYHPRLEWWCAATRMEAGRGGGGGGGYCFYRHDDILHNIANAINCACNLNAHIWIGRTTLLCSCLTC